MTISEKYKGKMIKKVSNTGIPKEEHNALLNQIDENKNKLYGLMKDNGYDVNDNMNIDELVGLLESVGLGIGNIKQIACGLDHTMVITNDGSLWACGYNNKGQLGLGNTTNQSTFTQVTTNINNDVKYVACGFYHTMILKNDGTVWGTGYGYPLGVGSSNNKTTFTQVTANINNDVKDISCGDYHTMILKTDGTLWAAGSNNKGSLGTGGSNSQTTFKQINTSNVKQVICRGHNTYYVKTTGGFYACGDNEYGQLGIGSTDTDSHTSFTKTASDVKEIACGKNFVFVTKNDNTIWACGSSWYGELGLNMSSMSFTSFNQVTTNISDVKKIYCTHEGGTFMLKNDGTLWACGINSYGQLGNNADIGNSNYWLIFKQITTSSKIKDIICGRHHVFVIKEDNSIWMTGYNIYGQLGNSSTSNIATFSPANMPSSSGTKF